MKKIAIIGIVGIPAQYGGFERFAEQLVLRLRKRFDVTVYCQRSAFSERPEKLGGVSLKYLPLNANGISSIFYDMLAMLHALFYADAMLILGVSGCLLLPFIRFFGCRKKIVVNIDGIEWRRAKWSKLARFYLRFSEKCAVRFSDEVVGDNVVIADYVKKNYRRDCRLIEYGADNLAFPGGDAENNRVPEKTARYAFGVCRIEPENNIHVILSAFAGESALPLYMVGNWSKSGYGRSLKEKYGNEKNIHLFDPIYDLGKLDALRSNCTLYLHGHCCGGTNPSLVEAMYLGLPIAAFDVGFNRATTEDKALYFKTSDDLRKIVSSAGNETYRAVGEKMREIARARYTWQRISDLYAELF